MRNKKSHRDPLLYIHQSNSQTPEAYMQRDYATRQGQPEKGGDKSHRSQIKSNRPIRKSSYFRSPHLDDENDKENEEIEADSDEQNEASEQIRPSRDKKFKDMDLEEKVRYFANAPAISPKLRCEVQTQERSYRGRIVDFAGNDVFMRVGRRTTPQKISFDRIIDIRLLGF